MGTVAGQAGNDGTPVVQPVRTYQVTGSWPQQLGAMATMTGVLKYTRVQIHDQFLAESCAIGDYDNDGVPDVASGRRWYQGPLSPGVVPVAHIFRGGHDELPRNGDSTELVTGVSDCWANYAWDMNGDGWTDIINIASPDVDETKTPNPAPAPQPHATAYWYENPGPNAGNSPWARHLMHDDVRHGQHGLFDVDRDGQPEIYGACKTCMPPETKGYYAGDWQAPTTRWTFHAVTSRVEFPFSGTGWLHGLGVGDVNGDGKPDLITREGVWTNMLAPAPDVTSFVQTQLYGGGQGEQLGGAHMFAYDVDGDGDADIVGADLAYNYGVSWYEQTSPGQFTKHGFVGTPDEAELYEVPPFSQAVSLEVADMDGDGVRDVITGKMRFARPNGYGDPDLGGEPVSYVFKVLRNTPSVAGPVTFQAHALDSTTFKAGIGRQIAIGHLNQDGILDVCIANKLGLYAYLGQ